MRTKGLTFLSAAILLAAWEALARHVGQPELVPTIGRLAQAFMDAFLSAGFYQSLLATIGRGLLGLLISFIAALAIAPAMARSANVEALLRPLIGAMRAVPVISFILLALIFLNPESIPLLIAFLTMFPLLTENLSKGIRQLNPDLSEMARLFRLTRRDRLAQVIYPQIKPYLFSGLASAAGFGWRAIIMGEVLSQCLWGIGSEMKRAQNYIEVPDLIVWTLVAILLSLAADRLITRLAVYRIPIHFRRTARPFPTCPSEPVEIHDLSYHYGISRRSMASPLLRERARRRCYAFCAARCAPPEARFILIRRHPSPLSPKSRSCSPTLRLSRMSPFRWPRFSTDPQRSGSPRNCSRRWNSRGWKAIARRNSATANNNGSPSLVPSLSPRLSS